MIEWCAMISVLVCSTGLCVGRSGIGEELGGGSIDLEGGVGCRVEIKGAFGLEEGRKGRELWFSLEVFNTQKLMVEPVGVEGGGVGRQGNTGDGSSSRWRKRTQHRL